MKHSLETISSLFLLSVFITFHTSVYSQSNVSKYMEEISIKTTDGLNIKADFYKIADTKSPIIILFHQARYSRGEYREIAPKLNELGFSCIAVDQRSGDKVNGVINETHKQAVAKGLKTEYTDAYPDLVSTLKYVKDNFKDRKIIVWGSSYSSALVFVLASEFSSDISAVLSFSPGDYFKLNDKSISYYAKGVKCPVFITSAKNEGDNWKHIFDVLPSKDKKSFLPKGEGKHGSKALWENNPDNAEYWTAVIEFLNSSSAYFKL